MNKIFLSTFLIIVLFGLAVNLVDASTRVRGHTTKRGTYVPSYYKSSPNSTKLDNWSTKGNYNPYTGKLGTKKLF